MGGQPRRAPLQRNDQTHDRVCQPVNDAGEPCAGEPHARSDAAAGGNPGPVGTAAWPPDASRRPYKAALSPLASGSRSACRCCSSASGYWMVLVPRGAPVIARDQRAHRGARPRGADRAVLQRSAVSSDREGHRRDACRGMAARTTALLPRRNPRLAHARIPTRRTSDLSLYAVPSN